MVKDIYIAAGIRCSAWADLDLKYDSCNDNWDSAINIFRKRFWSRYFDPITELTSKKSSPTEEDSSIFGFIILGTCFLLVETLVGFEDGLKSHNGQSTKLCVKGLQKFKLRDENHQCRAVEVGEAKILYSIGRCALLHSAGTEGVRVTATGPSIKKISENEYEINRTNFADDVKNMYEEYIANLRIKENKKLRENFIKKMSFVAGS